MVSFWPFGGDDRSAAEFEKILAALTEKINRTASKDAKLRSTQRWLEGMWMLYTGIVYLIAAIILIFVVGRSNWTMAEIGGLAGGPVIIYTVRLTIDAFYNYRISGTQVRLSELTKQRNAVIEKLKAATKYNSTQQLLDKYGGTTGNQDEKTTKRKPAGKPAENKRLSQQRTGLPPPPTANIKPPTSASSTAHTRQSSLQNPPLSHSPSDPEDGGSGADFAPNAFSPILSPTTPEGPHSAAIPRSTARFPPPSPHSPTLRSSPSHASLLDHRASRTWTERLMDAILGEDETQPRNRLALLCSNPECGLVNGLAPPGTRSLDDVGRWRCMACGAWNGVARRRAAATATGELGGLGHTPSASVTSFASSAAAAREGVDVVEDGGLRTEEDDAERPDEHEDSEEQEVGGSRESTTRRRSPRQRQSDQ